MYEWWMSGRIREWCGDWQPWASLCKGNGCCDLKPLCVYACAGASEATALPSLCLQVSLLLCYLSMPRSSWELTL